MFDLNVRSNAKEFTRYLDRVQKKQVPFALARALTWTVQDCQTGIIDRIGKVFRSRVKWWLKKQPTGIKIEPAKKDSLTACVYTKAYFCNIAGRWRSQDAAQGRQASNPYRQCTEKPPQVWRR